MERHANKTNAPETIKVPLQGTRKSGRTIFAYMRRSTTKAEQASSLPQQEEGIEQIMKEVGIDHNLIDPFVESKSGYENRSRKEWNKMLEAIDKCKEPCTLLCRDTSRLSRNPTDNLEIINRLFGDNKVKKSIQNIYFLGVNNSLQEWTDKTNKIYIVDTLHKNYTDSMDTKEKSMGGILLRLSGGEFPYTPPKGLSRVNSKGIKRASKYEKTTLMQNEYMPFIKRAFQMKVEGRTAKEISKYLKQYGKIDIAEKKIVETIISNPVYKGEYEEQTTKKYFDSIKFFDGNLPISKDLWDRANATIGKRGNGFGLGQEDHIAKGKLKYETGKSLHMYKAKGKYNAYQTEIKGENGERKTIGIMEAVIVKQFLDEIIPKIRELYYTVGSKSRGHFIKGQEQEDSITVLKFGKIGEMEISPDDTDEWIDEGLQIDLCGGFYDILALSYDNLLTINCRFEITQCETNGSAISSNEGQEGGQKIGEDIKRLWEQFYIQLWETYAIRYGIEGEYDTRDEIVGAILSKMDVEDELLKGDRGKLGKNEDPKKAFGELMKPYVNKHRKIHEMHKSPEFHENYSRCISLLSEILKALGIDISLVLQKIHEKEANVEQLTHATVKTFFERSPSLDMVHEEKEIREQQKKTLEQKRQALEEEKKNIDKRAFKSGFSAEFANEMKQETEKEIYEIQLQIDLLSESVGMEQYLERLPEILKKLHELSSKVLCEADLDDIRDDIKKLIDIVSHELVLNNKKELKIELYDTLNNLFFCPK